MTSFNYAIIGSGPAGVAAARQLSNKGACVIDVGQCQDTIFEPASLRDALSAKQPKTILGDNWELLSNLVNPNTVHPKLRSHAVRYVMNGEEFSVHRDSPTTLYGAGSHALGGMSNAWGGQLLRYTNEDLKDAGGWPITADELSSHYQDLEEHIGISGQIDDMHSFLGNSALSLPPLKLCPSAKYIYSKYKLLRNKRIKHDFKLGHPRLAIATEPFGNREAYQYGETEFLTTGQTGLYTAKETLIELKDSGSIEYFSNSKLIKFVEHSEFVELEILDLKSNETRLINVKHLLLGCGTIQTAKMVLTSLNETKHRLPFIDHPPTILPLFIPRMFGSQLPGSSFPTQLAGTLDNAGLKNIISFHYPGALLWSDLLSDIPLPMHTSLKALKTLLGGMLVAQMWEASHPNPKNYLCLDAKGSIQIHYPERHEYQGIRKLIRSLRPLGIYTLRRLSSMSPPGWGFHHAGCLPMNIEPEKFQTHIDGRLWNSMRVRVIDGSVLPSLPSKHHSFTVMANSARIADSTLKCEY